MKEKIRVIIENDVEGSIEKLDKSSVKQKVLQLFETTEIKEIRISYKRREQAFENLANSQ